MNIRKSIFFIFISVLIWSCKSSDSSTDQNEGRMNHLANESSPYLLQHARNPVDWFPWGEEALKKAQSEDKMIIVSIGYAACHWCHVMEHESFEDSTVAAIMNEHFVSIKVDREERPDVDDVYMTACQMSSGGGCGWPLNAFALPDGRPVWAGTYFPKDQWMKILEYFNDQKKNEPDKLQELATQITNGIQSVGELEPVEEDTEFTQEALDKIFAEFTNLVDYRDGGIGQAPKFPMPNNYQFLLQYYKRTGSEMALKAAKVTVDKLIDGGIYDQLGGGFARYSVDGIWKVPHFEKMMYDNGQLVSLLSKLYQITGEPRYKHFIDHTLDWVKREMTSSEGGFYSSLDADSEGEEGKFYVWKLDELEAVVSDKDQLEIYKDYFTLTKAGNWEHGNNILYKDKPASEIASKHNISEEELAGIISDINTRLFEVREKRIKPGLDDKILTSWNALMLEGYVDAYNATSNTEYLEAAIRNAEFIRTKAMEDDFRLNRNYKDGKSAINGFLDDYGLTAEALIALYQATFDEQWLNLARDLTNYALAHFSDDNNVFFNYTSDLDPPLIARKKELTDNVIPGSNSTMAKVLYTLGLYYYDQEYIARAKSMLRGISQELTTKGYPNYYSNWCTLYQWMLTPPYEIAIVGEDYEPLRQEMMNQFMPDAIFLGGRDEGNLELLKDKLQDEETFIYVCRNKVCKFPVREAEKAIALMN